uniref:Arrestin_C domain-containing protein n=1 Tax=Heterorhabditis bacteriophora TaxID=37862 RepID=A0A1I7XTM5_HETBA
MPLEVSTYLDRDVAIYLTGELIIVEVIVKNVSNKGRESLAWGSVQLTCERIIGAQPALRDRPTTAIARSASTVFSSPPTILFCDVQLNAGESRKFMSKISLPIHDLPPSFRGKLVKYMNRITIAVQHVRAPIKLTHLPVRIIPSVGLENKPAAPINPFLAEALPQATVSETVTAAVDNIMIPKKAHLFSLTNSHGKVTTMTLSKKTFRLGEDIIGFLNFEDTDVYCIQFSVHLESEERLAEDTIGEDGEIRSEGRSHTIVHAHDNSVCAYATDDSFRLSIPLQVTPTFHTDTVHLKWRLRFEFVTCKSLFEVSAGPGTITKAPTGQFLIFQSRHLHGKSIYTYFPAVRRTQH